MTRQYTQTRLYFLQLITLLTLRAHCPDRATCLGGGLYSHSLYEDAANIVLYFVSAKDSHTFFVSITGFICCFDSLKPAATTLTWL